MADPRVDQIIMGSQGGGVGDNLLITPLFKYFRKSEIEIIDTPYGRNLACLYDGLCNIVFKEKPITQEESFIKYGYPERFHPLMNGALAYLTRFGIENRVSPIPKIKLNHNDLIIAQEEIKKYKNPIAIVTFGRGTSDINDKFAYYKLLSSEKWNILTKELSKNYTILHFCKEKPLFKIDYCEEIIGLTLNQLKHYFACIGKYIGTDTGPYHLMLSVGGATHVIHPPSSFDYQYITSNWHYSPDLWWDESICRSKYYLQENYFDILKEF